MSSDQKFEDGMVNLVANLGTERDKAAHTTYNNRFFTSQDLATTYQNSWVAQAGIDLPAEDATRKWRSWQGEAEQITAIEKLEKKLGLQARVERALKMARLYGGSAIYINTGSANPEQPLVPGDEVKSLIVLGRDELHAKEMVRDISSEYYGSSEFYTIRSVDASQVDIHASRLVILKGVDRLSCVDSDPWGNSVLQAAYSALTQRDSTVANVASLIFEAKVDIFSFKGFADMMAAKEDSKVLRRLMLQATMKGINGAVVLDTEDKYDQKNASFSSLPELITKFQEEVSGAFGIPITRMFGRSAAGLSGSGDGDERVYYDRIHQNQTLDVESALSLLDECLIMQALGNRPEEIYYKWRPLRETSETDRAAIFSQTASALRALAGGEVGEIIPMDALSDSAVNELTELGVLPGLESKIAEYGSLRQQSGYIEEDEL